MRIFGFELSRVEDEEKIIPTILPPTDEDTTIDISSYGGTYQYGLDLDGAIRSEADLITRYRDLSLYPEVDSVIDDITNEAIISDDPLHEVVSLDLAKIELSEQFKDQIQEEFKYILYHLLNFKVRGYELFRRWYIDGRLPTLLVTDEDAPQDGIKSVRIVDPLKIRRVREIAKIPDRNGIELQQVVNDYYLFNDNGFNNAAQTSIYTQTGSGQNIQLTHDSVVSVSSGLKNGTNTMTVSYLHAAIRPHNQLRMLEDAAIISRLVRAPQRKIWNVEVGQLPKHKADQHMQMMMDSHKNKTVYDQCLAMNTRIPLLDGRTLTITELQKEFETGKQNWVYSAHPTTGKFAPGLITSAGVTRYNEKVMRLTLDNGQEITCTYDHKFPVWNKGKVEAQNLTVGDSMIPFYTREKPISNGKNSYQQIFENEQKKWIYTHRAVSSWKDEQKLENVYTFNLTCMSKIHEIKYAPITLQIFDEAIRVSRNYDQCRKYMLQNNHRYVNAQIEFNKTQITNKKDFSNFNRNDVNRILQKHYGVTTWKELEEKQTNIVLYNNHKITKIEYLKDRIDVGTLGIDKNEIYHNYHTFALESGIYTCNSTGNVVDQRKFMAMTEDYWIPKRNGEGTTIDVLPGQDNFSNLDEVEYFQTLLYKALKVPLSRVNPDSPFGLGRIGEITRDEVKFQKYISRLRTQFAYLFKKLLEKQLILKGFINLEEWAQIETDIIFKFAEDSYFEEQKNAELLKDRAATTDRLMPYVDILFPRRFIYKNIWQMNDDQIKENAEQIIEDIKMYGPVNSEAEE